MSSSEPGHAVNDISVAIMRRADQYLVAPRAEDQVLAGYWEFPGGKAQPGETARDAVVRECVEETGLYPDVLETLGVVEHAYPHGTVRITFFLCQPRDDRATPCAPFQWRSQHDLTADMFPPANAQVLKRLGFRSQ